MRQQITERLEMPFGISPANEKLRAELTVAITDHNVEIADIAGRVTDIGKVAEADWSAEDEFDSTTLRTRQREAIANELKLRGRIAEFFALMQQGHLDAIDAANNRHAQIESDIRGKLLALGFAEAQVDPGKLASIQAKHPAVADAYRERDAIQAHSHAQRRRDNEKAIEECRAALAEFKQRATAALSV